MEEGDPCHLEANIREVIDQIKTRGEVCVI